MRADAPCTPGGHAADARPGGVRFYELSESDWVLGEFVGDTDMLIVDAHDKVVISAGSYPRAEWYVFDSLPEVLNRYVQAGAEKYWERIAQQ